MIPSNKDEHSTAIGGTDIHQMTIPSSRQKIYPTTSSNGIDANEIGFGVTHCELKGLRLRVEKMEKAVLDEEENIQRRRLFGG